MSTKGDKGGSPTSPRREAGETEEVPAREGQGIPPPRDGQEDVVHEGTTAVGVSSSPAREGRRMESWADVEDQPMEEAEEPKPVRESQEPVRAPTAAELTALMQQPSMVAVLQSLVAQATANVQSQQMQAAHERIAHAEREAEEARREAQCRGMALEDLRSRQAAREAAREERQAEVAHLSERLRRSPVGIQGASAPPQTTGQEPLPPMEPQPGASTSDMAPLPRIPEEEEAGEWWTVGRHGAKRKSPTPGEPSQQPLDFTRHTAAEDRDGRIPDSRLHSEVRLRTASDDERSSTVSLMESARLVCAPSPRRHDLPEFDAHEDMRVIEFAAGQGPFYSRPRRCFASWTRFATYHLERLDEGWDIAEEHVGQRLTV